MNRAEARDKVRSPQRTQVAALKGLRHLIMPLSIKEGTSLPSILLRYHTYRYVAISLSVSRKRPVSHWAGSARPDNS